MKYVYTLSILVLFSLNGLAQNVFINEIHYDNIGTDVGEGLEIAGAAGQDLSCYQIYLYNGSNGSNYEPIVTLEGVLENESNGFGTIWVTIEGMQNGDNDAIALYNSCTETVEQFLSYEGMTTAVDGVAKDMTSVDIGVAEIGTDEGTSLQLSGSGMVYTDFIWAEASASSYGTINAGQTFGESTGNVSVTISPAMKTVSENADSVVLTLQATNIGEAVFTVNISVSETSTAILEDDFTLKHAEIMFDGSEGSNQSIEVIVYIINDEMEEVQENIDLTLTTSDETITIVNDAASIIIQDDDTPIASYTIAEVTTENADGVADSLEVVCELTGIVHSTNLRPGGLLFTLNDGEAGIGVFNSNNDFGYMVTLGDEITVQGTIGQYNGLTQIVAEDLTLISSGNSLNEPTLISDPDFVPVWIPIGEQFESEYIEFPNLQIVDPVQWEGNGDHFNVDFLAIGIFQPPTPVTIRIDKNTPLASLSLEEVTGRTENFEDLHWSIKGIGGQFDNEAPFTSGYQLFPFTVDDISILTVSVNDFEENRTITVFPNPAINDFIYVEGATSIDELVLYDLNGKALLRSSKNQLEVYNLSKGIYLLEIAVDGHQVYKKVVK